jgi:nucleotide-binding universal stress UspA family protein
MKKILVPCDFSPAAETAFKFAVNIASRNKSEIHLLHVVDTTQSNTPSSELPWVAPFNGGFVERLEQQLNEKFQGLVSKYSAESLSVFFSTQIGALSQNIERYILDQNIDMVAMGTKGASGFKELLIGSNTEKIVRNVKIPVVAVPLGANVDQITSIVFPVDPTEDPSKFLKELRFIQRLFQAKIHLLWINTPNVFKSNADALADLREFCEE